MKKFLMAAFAAVAVAASACWFTESNFNSTYIASVNGTAVHYSPVTTIGEAAYVNGLTVDLPITVQVKVSPRFADQTGEAAGQKKIVKAILQYKVVRTGKPSGPWITAKTLDNPSWTMDFANPINLFGYQGVIDMQPSKISAGDQIIIRVHFSDGMYTTGPLDADISVSDLPATQSQAAGTVAVGTSGWQAPHVFRVVYSGKRRVLI